MGKTISIHPALQYIYVYHMKSHSGDIPCQSSQCDKVLLHNASLKIHIRINPGERPFQCSQCGEAFLQKMPSQNPMMMPTGEAEMFLGGWGSDFPPPPQKKCS